MCDLLKKKHQASKDKPETLSKLGKKINKLESKCNDAKPKLEASQELLKSLINGKKIPHRLSPEKVAKVRKYF